MVAAATAQELGLSPAILDDLQKTFAHYPEIQTVLIFGSRARSDYRAGSDIDLAVVAPEMSDPTFSRLWNEIDELPIAYKMDVLHLDRLADAALRQQILRDGKVIYRAQ